MKKSEYLQKMIREYRNELPLFLFGGMMLILLILSLIGVLVYTMWHYKEFVGNDPRSWSIQYQFGIGISFLVVFLGIFFRGVLDKTLHLIFFWYKGYSFTLNKEETKMALYIIDHAPLTISEIHKIFSHFPEGTIQKVLQVLLITQIVVKRRRRIYPVGAELLKHKGFLKE